MKKRNIIISILVMGLSFLLVGFTTTDLQKDFASFDRAFIPPLALTNQEKLKPSKKGMKLLKQNWKFFKTKYYDLTPQDPGWKKDFDMIDEKIMEADKIVKGMKNLMTAHEVLEEIRFITLELRKRNKIEYYIDPLTVFHSYMEEIFHTGEENEPGDLTDEDINSLKETLSEAKKIWAEIGKVDLNVEVFGFDADKLAQLKEFHRKETKALKMLEKAIEDKDKPSIIKAAKGVKPNYAKLYKLFGDFESIRK